MKKLWKGYYDVIIFIVAFTSLLLWGCNPNPKNLFDRALSFSPQGFTTLERRIVASNITFDDFSVNDEKARMLHLKLRKVETETVYSVRLIECSNNTNAWKVYYSWSKQNFGTFKALLNAFPYLYGKVSGMIGKEFYTVWVYAQRVYIINGPDEETVKELEKLFKRYIKGVEPSDMV